MEKTTQTSISQEDLELSQKITSFIDRMNNPMTLKNGGDVLIGIDDALWNMEAAMNYTFADIPVQISETQLDSLEFVLNVNNGFCTESNLSALYQSMNASMQEYCNTLDGYHFILANVTVGDQTANDMTLKVYMVRGGGDEGFGINFGYPPDKWWHSYHWGYCDEPPPHTKKSSLEIQNKINSAIRYIPPDHANVPAYFTDIVQLSVPTISNPNYDPVAYPYRKYLTRYYYTFYDVEYGTDVPDNCLSPDDMSFFTNNIWDVINGSLKPAGKTLISASGAAAIRCWFENKMDEYHMPLKIDYGILHYQ
ncbi:MAG: hypothetical protein LBU83_02325 [Bacteroidales bacterium]|nr:hypothetical protein [Bacteroidales bacterium]